MIDRDAAEHSLPRAYLRPVVLLLVSEGPTHGYELLEEVRRVGIRLPDPGGLYRALRAMEHDGLLESWWEASSSGPHRRTYVLTAIGQATLSVEIEAMRERIALLSKLVDHADSFGLHRS